MIDKNERKERLISLIKKDLKELEENNWLTTKDILETRNAIYVLRNLLVEIEQEKNFDNSKARNIIHKWLEDFKK